MPTSIQPPPKGPPTHYAILSLPSHPPPTAKSLKNAYRRTLLLYHPDKFPPATSSSPVNPSVDTITLAYKTLSSPQKRADYDRYLAVHPNTSSSPISVADLQHPGLETVDLDDMIYAPGGEGEDGNGFYWRGCRCGREMAFEIPEKELEAWVEEGEVMMQCGGCSLWLRVEFGVVEGEDEGQEAEGEKEGG